MSGLCVGLTIALLLSDNVGQECMMNTYSFSLTMFKIKIQLIGHADTHMKSF